MTKLPNLFRSQNNTCLPKNFSSDQQKYVIPCEPKTPLPDYMINNGFNSTKPMNTTGLVRPL